MLDCSRTRSTRHVKNVSDPLENSGLEAEQCAAKNSSFLSSGLICWMLGCTVPSLLVLGSAGYRGQQSLSFVSDGIATALVPLIERSNEQPAITRQSGTSLR